LAASIAVGAAVAIVGAAPILLVAVASLAAIPLIVWGTVRVPELVIGTIAFSQILEGFELQTPLGTLSLGIVALTLFLGQRLPQVAAMVTSSAYRLGTVCLVAYVAGHGFQFFHADAALAARGMITALSFAAFVVLGMYVGARPSHVAGAAVGAATGLLVLAALALAANLGVVPLPAFHSPGREIFGFVSPFVRNYGLDAVPIGLLLPLCVPWLALTARSPSRFWVRTTSIAVLALIGIASFLLFQSRSIVLEIPLGILLVWGLTNHKFSTGFLVVGLCASAVLVAGLALSASTDNVSTQLRTESYATALDYFIANPFVLIAGTNPDQFHLIVNASLTYGSQIPTGAPTHDLLVETVVAGGVVSATGLVVLILAPLLGMLRYARRVGQFTRPMALALSAVVIAVIEASITPAIANSAGLWMTLGWAVAVGASATRAGQREHIGGDQQHVSGADHRARRVVKAAE